MLYIGTDHQGYSLKEKIKLFLEKINLQFEDCGAFEYNKDDDYPDFAKAVCQKFVGARHASPDLGILICATGIGMSIVANKFKHIRAALCCSAEIAKQARKHNNANILCLSKNADYKKIIKAFLETKFIREKRHVRRLKKL